MMVGLASFSWPKALKGDDEKAEPASPAAAPKAEVKPKAAAPAVQAKPSPARQPAAPPAPLDNDPEIPQGTEMVTMTVREAPPAGRG